MEPGRLPIEDQRYLPFTRATGLDLDGLDISATAISRLAARLPSRDHLICGDLAALSQWEAIWRKTS